jgi:hypothetical protein
VFHQKERYIHHLFFKAQPKNIQMITMGNSYGYINLDFDMMPVPAFHLSNTGEDIFETKYKYCYYVNYLNNLKWIILPVYYYQLFFDNSSHSKKRFEHRTVIYHSIKQKAVIDNDIYLHKLLIDVYAYFKKSPPIETLGLDFGVDGTNTLIDSSVDKIWDKNELDFAVDNKVIPALNRMIDVMLSNDVTIHSRAKRAFEHIVKDAVKRNINVLLIIPPFYERFAEKYRNDQKEITFNFCAYLKERYEQVTFYDFSVVNGLTNNHRFFRDVDHLNRAGRDKFTKLLIETIFTSGN